MQALHRRYRNLSRAQRHAIEEYEAIQAEHAEIESFDIDHHLQCHSTRTHARTHARTRARTHARTHERAHTSVCARVCVHEHTQKFIYFLPQTKSYTRNGVFLCGAVNGANPMHRTESSCAQEPRALLSGPAAARSPCWRRKIAQTESAPHRRPIAVTQQQTRLTHGPSAASDAAAAAR